MPLFVTTDLHSSRKEHETWPSDHGARVLLCFSNAQCPMSNFKRSSRKSACEWFTHCKQWTFPILTHNSSSIVIWIESKRLVSSQSSWFPFQFLLVFGAKITSVGVGALNGFFLEIKSLSHCNNPMDKPIPVGQVSFWVKRTNPAQYVLKNALLNEFQWLMDGFNPYESHIVSRTCHTRAVSSVMGNVAITIPSVVSIIKCLDIFSHEGIPIEF